MNAFTNILYYADGDLTMSPALQRAINLTWSNKARLTVVDVIGNFPSPAMVKVRFGIGMDQILQRFQKEQLNDLIADVGPLQHPIRTVVHTGWGFVEVIRSVLAEGYDLVIKSARTSRTSDCQLLSSSDMHLLRKCPCPVWIERNETADPYKMVLAAVDPTSEPEDDCADQIIDLAATIAASDRSRLSVTQAWKLPGESMLRGGRFGIADIELEKLLNDTRQMHSDALRSLLNRHELPQEDAEIHLLKGDAADVIQRVSQQTQADLIVMGTVGRTGIPGFIIGNTAEEVLQHSTCSVLAVKPSSFISPVKPAND